MALPQNGDWSSLVGKGENPNGMVSQTPNGTVVNGVGGDGCQFNWGDGIDGGWNQNPMPGCSGALIETGFVQIAGHRRRAR